MYIISYNYYYHYFILILSSIMKQLTNKQVNIISNRICNELHSVNKYRLDNFKKKVLPGLMKNVTSTKEYKNIYEKLNNTFLNWVTVSHEFIPSILNKKTIGKQLDTNRYDYFTLSTWAWKTLLEWLKERVESFVIKNCFDSIDVKQSKIEEEVVMSMLDVDSVDKLIEAVTAKFLSNQVD